MDVEPGVHTVQFWPYISHGEIPIYSRFALKMSSRQLHWQHRSWPCSKSLALPFWCIKMSKTWSTLHVNIINCHLGIIYHSNTTQYTSPYKTTRGSVLASTELSGLRCVTAGGSQLTAPPLLDLFYWRDAADAAILDLQGYAPFYVIVCNSVMDPLCRKRVSIQPSIYFTCLHSSTL